MIPNLRDVKGCFNTTHTRIILDTSMIHPLTLNPFLLIIHFSVDRGHDVIKFFISRASNANLPQLISQVVAKNM